PKKPIRGSRSDRRWALVFIGEHSKTIAFKHLKAAVVVTTSIILALGGLVGGLVYLYQKAVGDIRSLENKVVELNQAMQSLRDEKDILMARLVLTETINGKKPSGTKQSHKREDKSDGKKTILTSQDETETAAAAAQPSQNETTALIRNSEKTVYHTVEPGDSLYAIGFRYNVSVDQLRRLNHIEGDSTLHPGDRLVVKSESGETTPVSDQKKPEDRPPVDGDQRTTRAAGDDKDIGADVRNFTTVYEQDTKALRVEYVIRNDGSKSQQISGQTVVVLKSEADNPDDWLVLPPIPLESGKPDGKLGSAFSIYNFRTIRFKVTDQENADRFTLATVFVFSTDGKLALEKEFPVSINRRFRQ
ncbi:MAG: LysM peptidoglycan-binding domain-containing protein, partial [Desulfobacterales bacterium]